jgi:sporadic carbohydrate cluster 2OG-Fe(II) oxygenase
MKNFFEKKEINLSNKFKSKGYIISKVQDIKSLNYIKEITINNLKKILKLKKSHEINLNNFHEMIDQESLNDVRVNLINLNNKDDNFRYHYFKTAKDLIYILAGNELMMQKSINLSIQFPNDKSSLLPVHSDVWSGDSPFEINLWLPLVDCYRTKSMYILEEKDNDQFVKYMKKTKINSSDEIYQKIRKKVKWLNVKYGEFLLFNQSLPHGNIVNKEKETRFSMNCRFKSIYSPYGDKKMGEFFLPITARAMTEIGIDYKFPFKE